MPHRVGLQTLIFASEIAEVGQVPDRRANCDKRSAHWSTLHEYF